MLVKQIALDLQKLLNRTYIRHLNNGAKLIMPLSIILTVLWNLEIGPSEIYNGCIADFLIAPLIRIWYFVLFK